MQAAARGATCTDPRTGQQTPILDLYPEDLSCHASALSRGGSSSSCPLLRLLAVTSVVRGSRPDSIHSDLALRRLERERELCCVSLTLPNAQEWKRRVGEVFACTENVLNPPVLPYPPLGVQRSLTEIEGRSR
uniref:(California timema) hypothetical protein n=1 Tax=Timema californicum TaxID=61474 RepID=A0A7R9JJM4_TIMCA|nr:unnamed protein product [Timema californicum]